MDEKRRRKFTGYKQGGRKLYPVKRCHGILYDEGNVQVLWRSDIGHTAEQLDSIAKVFDLMPGLNRIDIEEDDDDA